jgi:hypothetical protein
MRLRNPALRHSEKLVDRYLAGLAMKTPAPEFGQSAVLPNFQLYRYRFRHFIDSSRRRFV